MNGLIHVQESQTALIIASDYNRKELIDMLIDRGADMNARNMVRHTYYYMAVDHLLTVR